MNQGVDVNRVVESLANQIAQLAKQVAILEAMLAATNDEPLSDGQSVD
jgi:hypothetical protein